MHIYVLKKQFSHKLSILTQITGFITFSPPTQKDTVGCNYSLLFNNGKFYRIKVFLFLKESISAFFKSLYDVAFICTFKKNKNELEI